MSESKSDNVDLTQMPVNLISCGKTGCDVNIVEDTLRALAEREKPAVVVAIVGLYRTGKSYLMNQLAGGSRKSGFQLGNTIQSKTKGIWIWVRPHPQYEDRDLILLDTEGLGDVKKTSSSHDKWIYYLATLLSSVLVHNSMGAFSATKVKDLRMFTMMKSDVKTGADPSPGDDLDFDVHFPDLIIALRDFGLALERDGKPITADEYLEDSLNLKKDKDDETIEKTNEEIIDYNNSRKCIRKYFPQRKCFTFDAPGGRKVLQNIEVKTEERNLSEEFMEELEEFQQFIYKEGPAKKLKDGSLLNGRRLSELLRSFVQQIKERDGLCIEDAVTYMADRENERAVPKALEIFKAEMENIEKPASHDVILNTKQKAIAVALEDFKSNSIADSELHYIEELTMKFEEVTHSVFTEHVKASETKCQKTLETLYTPIAKRFGVGKYNQKGSDPYLQDIKKMQKDYMAMIDLGMKQHEVLLHFKNGKFSITIDRSSGDAELDEEIQKQKDEIEAAAFESMQLSFKAYTEKAEKETQHIAPVYDETMKMRENEVSRLEKEGNIEEAEERKKEMDARNKMHKNEMQIKEEKLAEIKKEKNNDNIRALEENSTSHKWFHKQLAFWKNLPGESNTLQNKSK